LLFRLLFLWAIFLLAKDLFYFFTNRECSVPEAFVSVTT
jgi:hypothetical protein